MIYHIYWGTAGNAGLYLDEIYQTLDKAGFDQRVFVSYYYPFDYGEKVFFKRSEMEHCRYKGVRRKMMQAFELLFALSRILLYAIKDKPKVVNYSYVSRGNRLILLFLCWLKFMSKCCLIITCHDVVPIIKNKEAYNREIAIKRKIYALANYYLVHTENSKNELQGLFNVREDKILVHLFPLMDLSKLDKKNKEQRIKYDFLFIGHMRPEKGVDILYDAWIYFHKIYPDSSLCIAGNPNCYEAYLEERKSQCKDNNIDLNLGFIKDDDYISLIKASRCVIFPYTGGTNSGVVSTVVSLNKDIITSNIGMFADNSFVPRRNMFEAGKSMALLQKLIDYKNGTLISDAKEQVMKYRQRFDTQVKDIYSTIFERIENN